MLSLCQSSVYLIINLLGLFSSLKTYIWERNFSEDGYHGIRSWRYVLYIYVMMLVCVIESMDDYLMS